MAEAGEEMLRSTAPIAPDAGGVDEVDPASFREGFGEDLHHVLDLHNWTAGTDLASLHDRAEAEVRAAIAQESAAARQIRRDIFPRIGDPEHGAPEGAGVYCAERAQLERIHTGLLFSGGVEACDGTYRAFDTIPLTLYQIGVSLASYRGDQGSWGHRLFRRDLRLTGGTLSGDIIELLSRRHQRGGLNQQATSDKLSELAQRGIMAYAERALLLERSIAAWRMGHGNPAPYEILTGSGNMDLMVAGTPVIRRLVEEHQRFVFVASEPRERMLLTIGQALRPLEYAIVDTIRERVRSVTEEGHYRSHGAMAGEWDGKHLTPSQWIGRFRDEVTPKIVVGVYRAGRFAPPQVFYAHVDQDHMAAHIAIADSMLQEHRGFPLLIDLADSVCRRVFTADTLAAPVSAAQAGADGPYMAASERVGRYRAR